MGNFNRLNMWRPFVVVWSLKMLANGISVHHIFPFTYIVCKLVALFMLCMSVVVWLRKLKICCRSLSSVLQTQVLFHAFCFCALFLLLSPSVRAPSALCDHKLSLWSVTNLLGFIFFFFCFSPYFYHSLWHFVLWLIFVVFFFFPPFGPNHRPSPVYVPALDSGSVNAKPDAAARRC